MDTGESKEELDAITEKIIGCAHQVSNTLGSGFLEKVYESALTIELRKSGPQVHMNLFCFSSAFIGVYRRPICL